MARIGRPRNPDKKLTRTVSAPFPEAEADQFADTCVALGLKQAEVIRAFLRRFNEENRDVYEAYLRRPKSENEPYLPGTNDHQGETAAA